MERERPSQAELSRRFNCSQSTIWKITKNKDAILHEAEENKSASRKRKRSSKDDDVDAALYAWFVDARARDAPITSAVLEENANRRSTRILRLRMGGSAVGRSGMALSSKSPMKRRKTLRLQQLRPG